MVLANPLDWCSVGWAAERIGCSERTVNRLVASGVLRRHFPRKGRKEDRDRGGMLYVADVERYADARLVLAGGRA